MVVKSDEDVDGYGDGDRRDLPSRYPLLPSPNPLPIPYYFILTVHNLASNASHP